MVGVPVVGVPVVGVPVVGAAVGVPVVGVPVGDFDCPKKVGATVGATQAPSTAQSLPLHVHVPHTQSAFRELSHHPQLQVPPSNVLLQLLLQRTVANSSRLRSAVADLIWPRLVWGLV